MPRKTLPKPRLDRMRRRFQLLIDVAFDGNLSAAAQQLGMPVSTVHQYYQQGPRRIDAGVAARIQKVTKAPAEWLLGESAGEGLPPALTSWITYGGGELRYPPLVDWRVSPIVEAIEMRMSAEDKKGNPWEVFARPLRAAVDAGLVPARLLPTADYPPARDYEKVTEENRKIYQAQAQVVHTLCGWWERALADSEALPSLLGEAAIARLAG